MDMRRAGRGKARPSQDRVETWAPRTVALVGHRSAGKTSLGELLLQAARVTRTVGTVNDGTSLLDWTDEERRLQMTCGLSSVWFDHDGADLALVDTPGAPGLGFTQERGLHLADAALLVVDAGEGVELGTEQSIGRLRASNGRPAKATMVVVSKLERMTGSVEGLAAELEGALAAGIGPHVRAPKIVQLQLPWRDAAGALQGLVDVLDGRMMRYADDASGSMSPEPVPTSLLAQVGAAREAIAEAVAMTDDGLLEQYLEELELSDRDLRQGLVRGIADGLLVPMLLTSAARHIGAGPLLDALAAWIPPPRPPRVQTADGERIALPDGSGFVAEVVALQDDREGNPVTWVKVWSGTPPRGAWHRPPDGPDVRVRKLYRVRGPRRATVLAPGPGALLATWDDLDLRPGTTLTDGAQLQVIGPRPPEPQVSWWIRTHAPSDAVDRALHAVVLADPALRMRRDPVFGATLLSGSCEAHLRLAVGRVAETSGVAVTTALPPIDYIEVPAKAIDGVEAIHELRGDHGLVSEYGRCVVAVAPGPEPQPDRPLSFVDRVGDEEEEELPHRFRPAIGDGARDALRHGPLAGYPVAGVEVRLLGGDYDMLCSTEEHFRLAGERATRTALARCGTRLLEPWHDVRVTVPQEAVGELISDLSAHRGRVVGMEVRGTTAEVHAHCPFRELRTFASRLEALTGGRGQFSSRPSHHELVPDALVHEAVEASPFR